MRHEFTNSRNERLTVVVNRAKNTATFITYYPDGSLCGKFRGVVEPEDREYYIDGTPTLSDWMQLLRSGGFTKRN